MSNENINMDMTLHALITEVGRLEALANLLGSPEKQVLRECSIRINKLVLKKLYSDQVAYAC